MNKTVIRLARKYVTSYEAERMRILSLPTVIKHIDHFNWLVDMLQGNTYELEQGNKYYTEWSKVKNQFESMKVKAKNIICGKLVNVVILKRYDEDYLEVNMGRNRFVVRNEEVSCINI